MRDSEKDWAYLDRFRLENEKLKVHSDENRIVFIGDSIIAGWNQYSFFKENANYINRGINGQTSLQILHRFQADVIDLKPKVAVVLVGTNDIAENQGFISLEKMQTNFRSMIALAKANSIKLVLCALLPVSEYYWNKKIQPFDKIKIVNSFLRISCNENDIFYTDFYTSLLDDKGIKSEFSDDAVHPNKAGYYLMAQLLKSTLEEIFKK